jgi:hypothetical protein
MVSQQTIRRYILTGGIAAITATGAWYGAGLKTREQIKAVCPAPSDELSQAEAFLPSISLTDFEYRKTKNAVKQLPSKS